MTAGRGIVHSEMPEQQQGKLWGFQLWVNLPAEHKMMEPRYQDIPAADIPVVKRDDANIRVMAGKLDGHTGPVQDIVTHPVLLDVHLNGKVTLELPERGFLYVYEGAISCGAHTVQNQELGLLSNTGSVSLDGEGKALLVATDALDEPVARYGPFVMNTREELMQAFEDFQAGRL
jgi:redox-sensitive bicupin YhaK (pirin superfamily)